MLHNIWTGIKVRCNEIIHTELAHFSFVNLNTYEMICCGLSDNLISDKMLHRTEKIPPYCSTGRQSSLQVARA